MEKKNKKIKVLIIVVLVVIVVFVGGITGYVNTYYHGNSVALEYMNSTDSVSVVKKKNGYLFSKEGNDKVFIFYPGAKVECKAYAPVMRKLADRGIDCYLVDMPAKMAIFNVNIASKIMGEVKYDSYYIGGHSMGGAAAALYTAENSDKIDGLVLLAAYSTKPIDDSVKVLSLYGENDGVLDMGKYNDGKQYMPKHFMELEIKGGNHAGFGEYGKQKGDNDAQISGEKQQDITVDMIYKFIFEFAI